MAGFWGGTHFVSVMSSEILRLGVQRLTHRSASNKKTATRVDPVWGLTGVAVGYGPLESRDIFIESLCHFGVRGARWCFAYFGNLR